MQTTVNGELWTGKKALSNLCFTGTLCALYGLALVSSPVPFYVAHPYANFDLGDSIFSFIRSFFFFYQERRKVFFRRMTDA
jgi:hypothetical protein